MKIVRFAYRERPHYGILTDGQVKLLAEEPFSRIEESGAAINLEKVKLLAPVRPSKVVAVGLNYRDHAEELGMELPKEPVLFLKPPSSVIGPLDPVVYPRMSDQVEHEAELAVVIKNTASRVGPSAAADHILGYTCANDVTARDLQRVDGQWTRAKGFDTFCPLGPWIETEIRPEDLLIRFRLNGLTKQDSSTAKMIHNVFELVSFTSHVMTLYPGDVILTGTPPGVGPVSVGDTLEVEIEGIGTLQNVVV